MSQLLFRQPEQTVQSEVVQDSEPNESRGDAGVGMGSCCCGCLPCGQGTDSAGPETEHSSLEEQQKHTEAR